MNRQLRIVIKTIHSLHQGTYDMFDLEKLTDTIFGKKWRSVAVYETLEDAVQWHPDVEIIDRRISNEKVGLE